MLQYFNNIRTPRPMDAPRRIFYLILVLALGVCLGVASKWLDNILSNLLPQFIETLDLRNFFSRIGIWLFLATLLAVYSTTPLQAAGNVFLFFAGMVASYYAYTVFIAGFFPKTYMMIWVGLTIASPFLAFICCTPKERAG